MKPKEKQCLCGDGDYIVLSCSGASDVGEISDRVSRKLSANGIRKMNCLAVAAAGIQKSIESFNNSNILLIDGCPVDCSLQIANRAGLKNFNHLRITDLGYQKGKTGTSKEVVNEVFKKAQLIY